MMKRLLLPGFLVLFLFVCFFAAQKANAQDSTKKAEPEIKAVEPKAPETKAVLKTTTPFKKPAYHYHRLYPAATPAATAAVPATTKPAAPAPVQASTAVSQANKDTAKAQIDPAQLNAKSLNGQYQYLLSKMFANQQPLVAALWKNVNDTLTHARGTAKEMQAKLAGNNKTIDSLKADITSRDQAIASSSNKSDSISMFGLNMAKSTYNAIMISLVVILGIALAAVIGTTAKHKYEARHRTELYEEIEEEYKNFKAKANEKELKLARELQTERNKVDELMGRG
jgi:hypothetical protein